MIEKVIQRSIEENRQLAIIYQKKNEITKRVIHPISYIDHNVKAYDYIRKSPRIFSIENILAAELVDPEERRH